MAWIQHSSFLAWLTLWGSIVDRNARLLEDPTIFLLVCTPDPFSPKIWDSGWLFWTYLDGAFSDKSSLGSSLGSLSISFLFDVEGYMSPSSSSVVYFSSFGAVGDSSITTSILSTIFQSLLL